MLISFLPINNSLPAINQAEISLFGPGIGECIVLHFGQGCWFIIDSCLCPETKQPIALKYLEKIGVDINTQVKGILITHWHSDHIKGVAELFKACSQAKLYLSNALISKEAFSIVSLYKKDIFTNTDQDIRELSEIIEFLFETKERSRLVPIKTRHTFFDSRNTSPESRLVALSPSDVAVTQSISKLISLTPKNKDSRTRNVVPESENLNAVAVHFTFGDFAVVLGSDLEETGNLQTGWSAVFEEKIIEELSLPNASLFKVSHHGSKTGHHEKIWQQLLIKKPLSIATPYTRSGLPTQENIEVIKELSSIFLITRAPKTNKKIKRDNIIERELRAITKNRVSLNEKMGHIQMRITDNDSIEIAATPNVISF